MYAVLKLRFIVQKSTISRYKIGQLQLQNRQTIICLEIFLFFFRLKAKSAFISRINAFPVKYYCSKSKNTVWRKQFCFMQKCWFHVKNIGSMSKITVLCQIFSQILPKYGFIKSVFNSEWFSDRWDGTTSYNEQIHWWFSGDMSVI